VEVDLPEREVLVYRFDELSRDGARRRFAIECSSGTYVRSLIADLGDAYCEQLRRTRIGTFDVADAGRRIPLNEALAFLPEVRLGADDARRASHGVTVSVPETVAGTVRLTDESGLIALAESDGIGLRPVVGLRPL
jgi:tRNA pseudouridine55 synthase